MTFRPGSKTVNRDTISVKIVNMNQVFFTIFVVLGACAVSIHSHGRLNEPPNRSSLWRHEEFYKHDPPINYNDVELFCGGVVVS